MHHMHRGTCPMASIMGMAGVKMPEKPEASTAAPSNGANGVNGSSSFMKGKSLVPWHFGVWLWENSLIYMRAKFTKVAYFEWKLIFRPVFGGVYVYLLHGG